MTTRSSLTLAAHTPGPWIAEEQKDKWGNSCGWIINHINGRIGWSSYATAIPNEGERKPYPIGAANARLIAAAPDLLSVVQALLTARADPTIAATDLLDENNPLIDAARDAIAKALPKCGRRNHDRPQPRSGGRMRSAILYSALTKLSDQHYPVGKLPAVVYVRMKLVNTDYVHALDLAKPQDGETVLNSIAVDDQS
jgi:hypothetical protein